mgnify:FL=1
MRKVCKSCKIFVKGTECPICKSTQFTDSWKGRIYVQDTNKSEIAKKIGINIKGEYAIKVR